MDLDTDDEALRSLADGKQMDYAQWPALLSRLIPRLEKIVHKDFVYPQSKTTTQTNQPSESSKPETSSSTQEQSTAEPSSQTSNTSSQSTDKENAPPTVAPGILPPHILALLKSITSTLTTLFSTIPPHTIQRLSELILAPKQHYRTLPSYLHALDRVVHVTSGANIFPLPPAVPDPSSAAVLSNGTLASGADPLSISWGNPAATPQTSSLGSDESLGGALLTPIPWLTKSVNGNHSPLEGDLKTESTEMIDGPNGPGGVETVSVSVNGIPSTREASGSPSTDNGLVTSLRAEGGVTQGELLRQEQRAGVVPATQLQSHRERHGDSDGMGEDDEMPHARGPEEIGMEDMGPQAGSGSERGGPRMGMQGIDVEAAVGRKIDRPADKGKGPEAEEGNTTPKREAEEDASGDEKRVKEDTDVELVDADGRTEDEAKVGEQGENKGADAVDTSAL